MAKQAQIAKIHIAKQQLNIPEDAYRLMLGRYGVTSSTELTVVQAEKLIDELVAKGFKVKKASKAKGKPHNFNKLSPLITKIEALLADMKLEWRYADSLAKHMYKIDKVAWLKNEKQLEGLIAALYNKQQKVSFINRINTLFNENNTPIERRKQLLAFIKGGSWPERKEKMEQVIETLTWVQDV